MEQLPAKFFNKLQPRKLEIERFSTDDFERFERLTARLETGDKKTSEILQELCLLKATTDDKFLGRIWLKTIPRDIAAQLFDVT